MFEDVEFPEEQGYQSDTTFPFIQWVNGQKAFARLHPVLGTGGWAMQETNVLGELGWDRGDLPHKNGDTTPCYFAQTLNFALIAEKFRWFLTNAQTGQTEYLEKYQPGARGKYQVLVAVKEAGDLQGEPWMLTVKGMTAKYLYDAFKMYRSKLLPFAATLSKKRLPLYAFWCAISAGAPITVGTAPNTSVITPPAMIVPEMSNKEAVTGFLVEQFVGQDNITRFSMWWTLAQDWAKDKPKTETAEAPAEQSDETAWHMQEPPPDFDAEAEIPF